MREFQAFPNAQNNFLVNIDLKAFPNAWNNIGAGIMTLFGTTSGEQFMT